MGVPILSTVRGRAQSLSEFDAFSAYKYLDMDFAKGQGVKLLDKSPFHAHGDITTAAWAAGLHHRCLDFNAGTPDYVELTASQLNFTSEDFSIIMRLYADTTASTARLFVRGETDTDGYQMVLLAGGSLYFRTSQSGVSQNSYSGAGTISASTWCTLGISRSGTSVVPYIDGVDSHSTVGSHTNPATSSRTVKIAVNDNKADSPFDGKIEFLRVFGGIALPAEAHLWFHNMLK